MLRAMLILMNGLLGAVCHDFRFKFSSPSVFGTSHGVQFSCHEMK